jgi:hypothetical protein
VLGVGKVYLANASTAWAQYSVNGSALPLARPVAAGPKPPQFTPYFVVAPLGRYPTGGNFGYDDNELVVTFKDTDPPDRPHRFTVVIPRAHSVDDALILYAFRGMAMLLTDRGVPLDPNPLLMTGVPADPVSR